MTNRYFDHLYNVNEQELFLDLTQEVISNSGVECIYIVRDMQEMDELLREEKLSVFKMTYKVDVYVSDNGQCLSMQKVMSRFGYRFEESLEVIISTKTWDELGTGIKNPREGDFIYIGNPDDHNASFINCMYQINATIDGHPDTLQFGAIPSFKLSLQSVNKNYSNVVDTNYTDINDFLNPTEESENETTIKSVADEFTDFNVVAKSNPFTKWGNP